jgi:hypothetical protein
MRRHEQPTLITFSSAQKLSRTFESSMGRRVYVLPWPVCSDEIPPAGTYVTVELQAHSYTYHITH